MDTSLNQYDTNGKPHGYWDHIPPGYELDHDPDSTTNIWVGQGKFHHGVRQGYWRFYRNRFSKPSPQFPQDFFVQWKIKYNQKGLRHGNTHKLDPEGNIVWTSQYKEGELQSRISYLDDTSIIRWHRSPEPEETLLIQDPPDLLNFIKKIRMEKGTTFLEDLPPGLLNSLVLFSSASGFSLKEFSPI